jgi:hypothetical protein
MDYRNQSINIQNDLGKTNGGEDSILSRVPKLLTVWIFDFPNYGLLIVCID